MTSYAEFKKNINKTTEELKKKMESLETKRNFQEEDTRFWDIKLDDGGTGISVIRFLPIISEQSPFIKTMRYAFRGPMQDTRQSLWYINNSLQTIGLDDPVAKYNNYLYAKAKSTGEIRYEKQAKSQKRNVFYTSNILVIQDRQNPENEGKVFLYKYGEKVYQKIKEKLFPEFEGDKKIDVFNPWEGANFKMKVTKSKFKDSVTGEEKEYRNYDNCSFAEPSELFGGDDEKIEATLNKCYPLQPFHALDQFKTWDECMDRLEKVMGVEPGKLFIFKKETKDESSSNLKNELENVAATESVVSLKETKEKEEAESSADEDLDFFKSLAEED